MTSPRAPARDGELWWDKGLGSRPWQRHLLQLGYTDRLVGELIVRRRARLWDRAVIVVTADHGISFRGGDKRRAPTRTNLAELAFVPLFISGPAAPAACDGQARPHGRPPAHDRGRAGRRDPVADGRRVRVRAGRGSDTVKVGFGPLSRSFDAALEQRRASLRRQLNLFGSGSWGNGFFGVGPYESLLGRRVGASRSRPATARRGSTGSGAGSSAISARARRSSPHRLPGR